MNFWFFVIVPVLISGVVLFFKNKKANEVHDEKISNSIEGEKSIDVNVNKIKNIILICLITNCITLLCMILLLFVPSFQSDKEGFGALMGAEDVSYFSILTSNEEEFAGGLRAEWVKHIDEKYPGFNVDTIIFATTGFLGVAVLFVMIIFGIKRVLVFTKNLMDHTSQNRNFKISSFGYVRGRVCKTEAGCVLINLFQIVYYISFAYLITVFPLSFAEYYEGLMVLSGWFWALLIIGFGSLIGGIIATTIYSCKNRNELVTILYK